MFFIGLVPEIYKEIAVIYKALASKSTRDHTRGISKCSNGRPYKCLNHRIDPMKPGRNAVFASLCRSAVYILNRSFLHATIKIS